MQLCVCVCIYRYIGGEGVGGERRGRYFNPGGVGPDRREDPEGGIRRGVGGARSGLDSRSRREGVQPGLGTRPELGAPDLLLGLQQCPLQYLRPKVRWNFYRRNLALLGFWSFSRLRSVRCGGPSLYLF